MALGSTGNSSGFSGPGRYSLGRVEGEISVTFRDEGWEKATQNIDKYIEKSDKAAQNAQKNADKVKDTNEQVVKSSEKVVEATGDSADKVKDKFKDIDSSISKVSTALLGVSAAGTAGLGATVKIAADFESAMSRVKAVSGATAEQMEVLTAKARQIGKDTVFGATEAAGALEELVKAGVGISDIMNGAADATVTLAIAGGVSLPEAATLASNALNNFRLTGKDMARVADIIAGAANASAIDVKEFGYSLQQVGAVASVVGLSFEDTATAIALLGNSGIKGSDAGTSLKTMLLNLQPTTKKQINTARELGLYIDGLGSTFFDANGKIKPMIEIAQQLNQALAPLSEQQRLQALEDLFGQDAIRAAAILGREGANGFKALNDEMNKVSAADVAKTNMDNLNGKIEDLKGSLEELAISVGDTLIPKLKDIVDTITKLVDKFNALDPRVKNLIIDFILWGTILTGVVGGLGKLYGTVKTLHGAFTVLRGALFGTSAAGAAASTGISGAAGAATKAGPRIASSVGLLTRLGPGLTVVTEGVSGAASALSATAGTIGTAIAGISAPVWGLIAVIAAAIAAVGLFAYWNWDEITAYWELSLGDLRKIVSKKFAEIYIEFQDFKREAKKHIAGIVTGMVTSFSGFGESLKSVFTLDYGGYKEGISKFASGVKQSFREAFGLAQKTDEFGNQVEDSMFSGLYDAFVAQMSRMTSYNIATINHIQKDWQAFGVPVVSSAFTQIIINANEEFENLKAIGRAAAGEVAGYFFSMPQRISESFNILQGVAGGYFSALRVNAGNSINEIIGDLSRFEASGEAAVQNMVTVAGAWLGQFKDDAIYKLQLIGDDIAYKFNTAKDNIIRILSDIPLSIAGIFRGFNTEIYNSGVSIIQSFIDGMQNNIGVVAQVAKNVVSAARNYFPFSPAKKGPFSGSGWVLYSGRSIGNAFAQGMADTIGNVQKQASDLIGSASNTINNGISNAKTQVDRTVRGFADQATNAINSLPGVQAGKNFINGITAGVRGQVDLVKAAVEEIRAASQGEDFGSGAVMQLFGLDLDTSRQVLDRVDYWSGLFSGRIKEKLYNEEDVAAHVNRIVDNLSSGIVNNVDTVSAALDETLHAVVGRDWGYGGLATIFGENFAKDFTNSAQQFGKDFTNFFSNGIFAGQPQISQAFTEVIENAIGKGDSSSGIKAIFGPQIGQQIADGAKNLGHFITRGLGDGIREKVNDVKAAVEEVVYASVGRDWGQGGLESLFGKPVADQIIRGAEQIGGFVNSGIVQGILKLGGNIQGAIGEVINSALGKGTQHYHLAQLFGENIGRNIAQGISNALPNALHGIQVAQTVVGGITEITQGLYDLGVQLDTIAQKRGFDGLDHFIRSIPSFFGFGPRPKSQAEIEYEQNQLLLNRAAANPGFSSGSTFRDLVVYTNKDTSKEIVDEAMFRVKSHEYIRGGY